MSRNRHPYTLGELVIVIDCHDLDRSARFWTEVLGYVADGDPDGIYLSLVPADGPGMEVLLQRTGDEKAGKNRVHLDLRTPDMDAEVERVTALGATAGTDQPIDEDGWRWHVLADPDGNEFCVVGPPDGYFTE
jgi:predicted enzyme related to lactoylglutathione lyase